MPPLTPNASALGVAVAIVVTERLPAERDAALHPRPGRAPDERVRVVRADAERLRSVSASAFAFGAEYETESSVIAPEAESVPPPTYVSTLPTSFAVAVAPLTLSRPPLAAVACASAAFVTVAFAPEVGRVVAGGQRDRAARARHAAAGDVGEDLGRERRRRRAFRRRR